MEMDGRPTQVRQRTPRHFAQRKPERRPHVSDRRRQLWSADRRGLGGIARPQLSVLLKIRQIKGQSETHPALSPNDEFANYEVLSYLLGEPQGRFDHIVGSYARQALKDGLAMQDTKGYNPYKFGVIGASDSHNTGTPYRQDNFYGGHAHLDGTIETRMAGHVFAGLDTRLENPAGLAGVWAEENTRESIFEAMQRKETFAVSGPHIKLRFFGGWEYKADDLKDSDWVKTGYGRVCRWAAT